MGRSDRDPPDTSARPPDDAAAPTYDAAPPTIEQRLSAFHPAARARGPRKATMPGHAAPAYFPTPTAQHLHPPDGPTIPDGMAALPPVAVRGAFPAIDGASGEAEVTDTLLQPRATPAVPEPGAPRVQVSKSMEIQVADLAMHEKTDPSVAPALGAARLRRRAAAQPTAIVPALSRKRKDGKKEKSDWPLILGLAALFLVIVGLVAVTTLGVLGRLR